MWMPLCCSVRPTKPFEMESHLALGLYDLEGNRKPSYEMYKKLGTENEGEAKERASEIIGMDIDEMIRDNIVWTREGTGRHSGDGG